MYGRKEGRNLKESKGNLNGFRGKVGVWLTKSITM